MGVCTSDPLGYLIKEYGADVCKYIVAIKAEDYVQTVTPKLAAKVQDQFKNTAGSLDKQFDSRQSSIKNNYSSVITDVKQNNPSVLQAAKSKQNKTEQQIFGFDSIQKKFNDLKAAKDNKIKDQQTNVLKLLQDQKENIKKNIQDSKPSLPLFDSMPLCLRQKVLSEGEAKFAPQIKKKQQQITSLFDKVTNVDGLKDSIKKAAGLNEADRLVKDSSSTFEKAKKAITFISRPQQGGSCFG